MNELYFSPLSSCTHYSMVINTSTYLAYTLPLFQKRLNKHVFSIPCPNVKTILIVGPMHGPENLGPLIEMDRPNPDIIEVDPVSSWPVAAVQKIFFIRNF